MRKKIGLALLIIALLVFARFAYVKFTEAQTAKSRAAAMMPVVSLDSVKEEEISNSIEAPGRIAAKYSVDIVAKVSGSLLRKHFMEGDYVQKGQLLFSIDPQEYAINVNKAAASLQNAQAVAFRAQKDYERAKELVANDFIAKSTYDQNLAERNVANANIKSAAAQLSDAKRLLSYTKITAPVSGRIGMVNVTEGNYITAQTGPLAKLVSLDPIYVTYSLDSKQFNQLRDDTILPTVKQNEPIKVQIVLPDGTTYEHFGAEDFFGNEISQTTGSIPLRATFKNPEHILIPGDFVKVKIYSNTKHKKPVVPQAAVMQDSTGRYVYTVDADNKAVQTYITTEGDYGDYFIVKEGLKPGDKFIATGVIKVMNGMGVKVVPIEENPEAKAAQAQNNTQSQETDKDSDKTQNGVEKE